MLWSLLFISLIGSAHLDNHKGPCKNITISTQQARTSQSSDYVFGNVIYSSERAINGNLSECSNSMELSSSWWRIDLQGFYNISSVGIYNKNDHSDHSNIRGAQIYIGNSLENNGTNNSICTTITNFLTDVCNNITCDKILPGRYITVSFQKTGPAVLCDVQIYGTRKESPFVLVNHNKTWGDALNYCRTHHSDLASILDEDTQAWAELEVEKADTPFVWLGLHFTCTLDFWFWVEGFPLKFNCFAKNNQTEACDISVAMETQNEYQWFSMSVYTKFNFICTK